MDSYRPPDLSNYRIFSRLPEAGIARLQAGLRRMELEPGDEIIRPGEYGNFLGIVTEGELVLENAQGGEQRVQPGGHFGEGMLRYGVPSAFRGRAATAVVAWLVTRSEFLAAQKLEEPVHKSADLHSPPAAAPSAAPPAAPDPVKKVELPAPEVEAPAAQPARPLVAMPTRAGVRRLRLLFAAGLLALAWLILGPLALPAFNQGVVELLVGLDRPQAAESYLELAFRLQPDTADLYDAMGAVQFILGDYPQAIQNLEKAVSLDPELASAHNNLAVALTVAGQAEEAVPHLEKAVELDPGDALLFYNLGNARLQAGQNEPALRAYQRAVELDPQNQVTRARWAAAAASAGDLEAARQVWESILSKSPNDPQALALAYQGLGMLELGQGKPAQALVYLESARAANPVDPLTYLYLGAALEKLDLLQEAVAVYREALRLSPEGSAAFRQAAEQLERLEAGLGPSTPEQSSQEGASAPPGDAVQAGPPRVEDGSGGAAGEP